MGAMEAGAGFLRDRGACARTSPAQAGGRKNGLGNLTPAALVEALPEVLDADGLVMLAAVVAGCEPGDVMICGE